jgi:predicted nucleotide-binding protein
MGQLRERFSGEANRSRLFEAVAGNKSVAHDSELARKFIDAGELVEVATDEILIKQGDWDDDVYLVLAGEFDVIVNGRATRVRGAGEVLGELSAIEPGRARIATLRAKTECLVLKLTRNDLETIAGENAAFWRRVANSNGARLEERNSWIGKANDIPRVFVVSSSEGKEVMDLVAKNLDGKEIAVETWDKGVFRVSDYPISVLMDAIEAVDFVVAIVRADDIRVSRGVQANVVRDNVSLEYGIALGCLGRLRSILLVCGDDGVQLPSDLAGLTTLRYSAGSEDELRRSVRNACFSLREHVLSEGVFVDRRPR